MFPSGLSNKQKLTFIKEHVFEIHPITARPIRFKVEMEGGSQAERIVFQELEELSRKLAPEPFETANTKIQEEIPENSLRASDPMILESGKTLADYNIQKLTNVKVPFKRKKESKQAFHKLKSVGRRSNDSFGSRTNPSDSEPQYQQPKQHVTRYDFEFHAKNPGFVFDPKQNKWFNLQCPNPNYLGKHFDLRKAKSQRLPSSLNLSSQTIWELNRESSQAKPKGRWRLSLMTKPFKKSLPKGVAGRDSPFEGQEVEKSGGQ